MPTIDVPGCTLRYEVLDLVPPWAEKRTPVLLHHGLGACADTFAAWLPYLAGERPVIRFDFRGHGGSGRPTGPASLDRFADDVIAVANAAGARSFHLYGESIGGTIALHCAHRHAGRIASLAVSNGAHLGASIASVGDWRETLASGGMAKWSAQMMPKRFYEGAITEAQLRWYEAQQATSDPDFLLAALGVLVGADLSDVLPKLALPVLLMHGDGSPFIPVAAMAELKSRLPEARLHVFHARHGLPFSHGAQCAALLRDFLDEVE
jgi:pimeloyl-ACP methyl ester carboxylesterase